MSGEIIHGQSWHIITGESIEEIVQYLKEEPKAINETLHVVYIGSRDVVKSGEIVKEYVAVIEEEW